MRKLHYIISSVIMIIFISSIILAPVTITNDKKEESDKEIIITEESKNEFTTEKVKTKQELVKVKNQNKTIKQKEKYTDEELYIMSHLIYGEAGNCSDELQIAVGSVVLNRVKSKYFPNTIKEVVFQKGQYACTWDGNYDKSPDEQAINNSKYLLESGSQLPAACIFQAEFIQGDGVYKTIGNTYICYKGELYGE